MRRRGPVVALLLAAAVLLTGCAERSGDEVKVGEGTVAEWKQPTTGAVRFSGSTVTGGTFDSKRYLGKVVVVNFWYAGCPPCRAEAADLNAIATSRAADDVQFVGVNTIDSKATAAGFVSTYGTPYPSIVDQAGGGSVQLAFADSKGPGAVPSTLVLDRRGRVVARVLGGINRSVLDTLITDAVDGTAT